MLNESKNPMADLMRGFRLAGDAEEAAAMVKNYGKKPLRKTFCDVRHCSSNSKDAPARQAVMMVASVLMARCDAMMMPLLKCSCCTLLLPTFKQNYD